jgi:hypothetical protein
MEDGLAARELLENQLPLLAGCLSKHNSMLTLSFESERLSYTSTAVLGGGNTWLFFINI